MSIIHKKLTIFAVALAVVFLLAVAAQKVSAQETPDPKKGWQEKISQMLDQLDLTDEQRQALNTNREAHRARKRELKEQIQTKREEFYAALKDPETDENAIYGIYAQIKSLKSQIADDRLDGILNVRRILTPEQFIQFHELKEQQRESRWRNYSESSGQGKE